MAARFESNEVLVSALITVDQINLAQLQSGVKAKTLKDLKSARPTYIHKAYFKPQIDVAPNATRLNALKIKQQNESVHRAKTLFNDMMANKEKPYSVLPSSTKLEESVPLEEEYGPEPRIKNSTPKAKFCETVLIIGFSRPDDSYQASSELYNAEISSSNSSLPKTFDVPILWINGNALAMQPIDDNLKHRPKSILKNTQSDNYNSSKDFKIALSPRRADPTTISKKVCFNAIKSVLQYTKKTSEQNSICMSSKISPKFSPKFVPLTAAEMSRFDV